MEQFEVTWIDREREPTCPPDPAYPNGIDVDCAAGKPACFVTLPYPAKRCGFYKIHCTACQTTILCTTAGRADDPRSVSIACQRSKEA